MSTNNDRRHVDLPEADRFMMDKETRTTIGTALAIICTMVTLAAAGTWWLSNILHEIRDSMLQTRQAMEAGLAAVRGEVASSVAQVRSDVVASRRDAEVWASFLAERNDGLNVPVLRDIAEGQNPRNIIPYRGGTGVQKKTQ